MHRTDVYRFLHYAWTSGTRVRYQAFLKRGEGGCRKVFKSKCIFMYILVTVHFLAFGIRLLKRLKYFL